MLKLKKLHKKYPINTFIKVFYSDKSKNLGRNIVDKEKKDKLLQETSEIITEDYKDCTRFEQQAIKQVLMEKEKDASLRSHLSKECKTLFTAPASKVGPKKNYSVHLDPINLHKGSDFSEWESYSFNHLQSKSDIKGPTDNKDIKNDKTLIGTVGSPKGVGGTSGGSVSGRPIRQEPGKVLFCVIPEEWWRFFIPKTGVTGFGTFMITFITFLVSKEIYVLEHNYYNGLSVFITVAVAVRYLGNLAKQTLDKSVDEYEASWNEGRLNEKQALEDQITDELFLQFQSEGQVMLIDAKRENVHLQLEEEFRKRQMHVYDSVKQRLEYQVALELVKQRIHQKNLVQYVTKEVQKAITPEMQSRLIYYSIDKIVEDLNKGRK